MKTAKYAKPNVTKLKPGSYRLLCHQTRKQIQPVPQLAEYCLKNAQVP